MKGEEGYLGVDRAGLPTLTFYDRLRLRHRKIGMGSRLEDGELLIRPGGYWTARVNSVEI